MVIDFKEIGETAIPEFKGGKGRILSAMHVDDMNRIMFGRLEPGCTVGLHTHDTSSEIIYIVSGQADCIYDDTTETVGPGGCHYCPKGHSHSLINNGTEDLVFFAVVPQQ